MIKDPVNILLAIISVLINMLGLAIIIMIHPYQIIALIAGPSIVFYFGAWRPYKKEKKEGKVKTLKEYFNKH